MNTEAVRVGVILLGSIILSGCAIGYNSVLFVTKSNVGIDIDTKPPTAQIAIARLEGVFEPTFEGGQTPPVVASFRSEEKGILGLFYSVASTFAGGDAATTLAATYPHEPVRTPQCLTVKPLPRTIFGAELTFPEPGQVRPFIFGTDTSFGLKVAWSGLTAQVPDTVRLGYQRKEVSWAPVFVTEKDCGSPPTRYSVNIPPFLATIDIATTLKEPQKSGFTWVQHFATGEAATSLTLREDIRKVLLERLNPQAAKLKSFKENQDLQNASVKRIQDTYKAADEPKKQRILTKAVALKLVPPDTNDQNFAGRLSDAVDGEKPEITKKLDELDEFSKSTSSG